MPRWKALPEELDPEIREFAGQMRQLVDRSGLGLSALSDRTGYSKTSWERYLNGRLLPPQGAVSALAEVTGTDVRHLATMWELAERAWSRAEMRHDMTMEAIRISQAREALAAAGRSEDGRKKGRGRAHKAPGRSAATVADRPGGQAADAAPAWAGGRGGSVADAPAHAPADAPADAVPADARADFDSTAVLRRQSAPADRTTPFDRPAGGPAPADRTAARPRPAAGGFSAEPPGPSP
ncbi:helix-turn-helix domain-containing protein, partial [Streptomyces durbertensis]|uniref:helix-turn-helix domain-containing protein n=1 Tax=Streptomyces durbertensis TaxID=2448886 RepID=UPI001E3D7D70